MLAESKVDGTILSLGHSDGNNIKVEQDRRKQTCRSNESDNASQNQVPLVGLGGSGFILASRLRRVVTVLSAAASTQLAIFQLQLEEYSIKDIASELTPSPLGVSVII